MTSVDGVVSVIALVNISMRTPADISLVDVPMGHAISALSWTLLRRNAYPVQMGRGVVEMASRLLRSLGRIRSMDIRMPPLEGTMTLISLLRLSLRVEGTTDAGLWIGRTTVLGACLGLWLRLLTSLSGVVGVLRDLSMIWGRLLVFLVLREVSFIGFNLLVRACNSENDPLECESPLALIYVGG